MSEIFSSLVEIEIASYGALDYLQGQIKSVRLWVVQSQNSFWHNKCTNKNLSGIKSKLVFNVGVDYVYMLFQFNKYSSS